MGLVNYGSAGAASAAYSLVTAPITQAATAHPGVQQTQGATQSPIGIAFSPLALGPHTTPLSKAPPACAQEPLKASILGHRMVLLAPVPLKAGVIQGLIREAVSSNSVNFPPELATLVNLYHGPHTPTFKDCFFINSATHLRQKLEQISHKLRGNSQDLEVLQGLQELQSILLEDWPKQKPAIGVKWEMFLNNAPENVAEALWKHLWMAYKDNPALENFLRHLIENVPAEKGIYLTYFEMELHSRGELHRKFLDSILKAHNNRPMTLLVELETIGHLQTKIEQVVFLLEVGAKHRIANLTVKINYPEVMHLNLSPIINQFIEAWKGHPNAFLRIERDKKPLLIMQKANDVFNIRIWTLCTLDLDDLASELPEDISAFLKKGDKKLEKPIGVFAKSCCIFM